MPDAIVISDLHLGSPFAHTKKITSFIESLSPDTQLIVNGDILHEPSTKKITENGHAKTLQLLSNRKNTIFTAGNHDVDRKTLSELLGAEVLSEYLLKSGNKQFLVTHGHKLDIFIGEVRGKKQIIRRKLGNYFASFVNLITRSESAIFKIRRVFDASACHILFYVFKYRQKAVRLAAQRGCSGIIMGHMHYPELLSINNVMYCNSGSWVKTHDCTYLVVKDGSVTLHTF